MVHLNGLLEQFTQMIHSDEKLYVLKTFGNLYVFNFMEICAYQTSGKKAKVPVMESAESGGTI